MSPKNMYEKRKLIRLLYYKSIIIIIITELFYGFLNFSGVEAGPIVCVLEAGSVDDGNAFIIWIS